jgi:hypothetical protein
MRLVPKLFPKSETADAALIRLVKAGFGEWAYPLPPRLTGKGGRPSDRRYVPKQILDKTSPIAGKGEFCHSEGAEFPYGANEGAA